MDEQSPLDLLKTFPGVIHRHALFTPNHLDVASYHISFLTKQGDALDDNAELPLFIDQLPSCLQSITEHQSIVLSIPKSWQAALVEQKKDSLFCFAINASSTIEPHPFISTLLIDLNTLTHDFIADNIVQWQTDFTTLCATNVNNIDDYNFCKLNNFALLQGHLYTLPSGQPQSTISPSIQILMQLLLKLQDDNIEPEELADTINQDITLSYKLLRLINSAFFGLPREISNTQQALVMIGFKKVQSWASLLSLSNIKYKPAELSTIAMTRAKMCELLAQYYTSSPETFFTAGLFSTLDALMDKPLKSLITDLPLSPELQSALINKEGNAGEALKNVLNFEQGNWQAISSSAIPINVLTHAYLDALHWAVSLKKQLQD